MVVSSHVAFDGYHDPEILLGIVQASRDAGHRLRITARASMSGQTAFGGGPRLSKFFPLIGFTWKTYMNQSDGF